MCFTVSHIIHPQDPLASFNSKVCDQFSLPEISEYGLTYNPTKTGFNLDKVSVLMSLYNINVLVAASQANDYNLL